ncbi:hypothetical protein [Amycolatopsis sp. NPDC098790]|uniref:hypothetical protein n=1 Tax=Amycolatopsis sp. NPDC098790 TaxID=3363939 RepID=UPI00382DFA7E
MDREQEDGVPDNGQAAKGPLAEEPAPDGADEPLPEAEATDQRKPKRSKLVPVAWALGTIGLGLGLLGFVARLLLVKSGVLYGTAVAQADWVLAASLTFGGAWTVLGWSLEHGEPAKDDRRPMQRWTDGLACATGLASAITLVVTLVNLFEPATPPEISTAACPGAPVRQAGEPYLGLTAGPEGNNSRSGPSSASTPNGRFPKGCSVAFSFYCIGQSVKDSTGSTDEATWYTSRWLVVARQRTDPGASLARILSHEVGEDRYVSDAYVTPQSRYDRLPYGDSQCQDFDKYPLPGKSTLEALDAKGRLQATAPHAVNMGFALWVPGRAGFSEVEEYRQIYTTGSKPEDNPGETGRSGTKSVSWAYSTAAGELTAPQGTVAVMAVPCLADNIPADTSTAAVDGYEFTTTSADGRPAKVAPPAGVDRDRLARTACSANT